MTERLARILVLGLGNDILGDDAVGLLAARRLRVVAPESVDSLEAAGGGLELLDLLEGYDRALLLDAIVTGNHPPGAILEFSSDDFQKVVAPTPHYAGLPEVLRLAACLAIPVPRELCVLAMEVEDPYCVREGLSPAVERALPDYVARASRILSGWSRRPLPGDAGGPPELRRGAA